MKRSLDAEHPQLAMELNNLATLYQSQNRLDQSEEVYRTRARNF